MGSTQSVQPKGASAYAVEAVKPIGAPDSTTVQPLQPFGAISFDAKEVVKDMSSKIQLSVRCEELAKIAPVFVVVYSKSTGDDHWSEIGMSDVCSTATRNPIFDPSFTVDFHAELQCLVRFEVYRVRDRSCLQELISQKFVGMTEVMLVDMVMARSQGNGWLVKELLNPKPKAGHYTGRIAIWAEEEQSAKYMASFTMVSKGLKSTDIWKRKADPYAVIHRTLTIPHVRSEYGDFDPDDEDMGPGLKCTPVYHTEVQRRTNGPTFNRVELSSAQLCMNNEKQEIVVEFFDFFRVRRHQYMGEAVINFAELNKAHQRSRPLEVPIYFREGPRVTNKAWSPNGSRDTTKESTLRMTKSKDRLNTTLTTMSLSRSTTSRDSPATPSGERGGTKETKGTSASDGSWSSGDSDVMRACGPIVGGLRFMDIGVERRYSFLDYVRGGLELRLMVAVDFSRSNTSPAHPDSCHYASIDRPSAYATAIRSVGDVMRSYTSSARFTAFGFGAKIPPSHTVCSNCFSLNGNFFDPEIEGVDNVIKAYQRALHIVHLHGPTRLAEAVRLASSMSRPYAEATTSNENGVDMRFHLLLILTDGAVDDRAETVAELANAWDLPMAAVVVGVGDGEGLSFLRELGVQAAQYKTMLDAAKPPAPPQDPRALFGEPKVEELSGPLRNVVRYVPYKDYRDRPAALAAAALAELPQEVVGYYTGRNIKPRGLDKMEDREGRPLPKVIPRGLDRKKTMNMTAAKQSRTNTLSTSRGTSATATSIVGTSSDMLATTSSSNKWRNMNVGAAGSTTGAESTSSAVFAEKKRLENLPQFIHDEKARLFAEAEALGYEGPLIRRAFRDGVPSNALDVLIDNIVHGGYGRLPSYRDAAENAIPEVESNLPGQPIFASTSSRSAADYRRWMSQDNGGGPRHSMVGPLPSGPLGLSESRPASRSILVHSREVTKERTKDLNISFNLEHPPVEENQVRTLTPRHLQKTQAETLGRTDNVLSARAEMRAEASEGLRSEGGTTSSGDQDLGMCGICLERPIATELQPCMHRLACQSCAMQLGVTCPLCNGVVREVRNLR